MSSGREVSPTSIFRHIIFLLGNKKASTKGRLLNENISQAVIDEKFQITTLIDVDESGRPLKDKMVRL